jgi:serpin B
MPSQKRNPKRTLALCSLLLFFLPLSLAQAQLPPPSTPQTKKQQTEKTNHPHKAEKTQETQAKRSNQRSTLSQAKQAAQSNNRFALALFRQLTANKERSTKNIFFSPWSTHLALSMLFELARKETNTQMQKALFLQKEKPIREQHRSLSTLLQKKEAYTLHTSQKLWSATSMRWAETLQNKLTTYYRAPIHNLPFQSNPDGARQTINKDIALHTKEKIKDLLPPRSISPLTRLVLTSCIYFLGEWKHRFKKEHTQEDAFFLPPQTPQAKQRQIRVHTMQQQGSFRYTATPRFHLLVLPYKGPMEMWLLLPKEGNTLRAIERSLLLEELNAAAIELETKRLRLYLPRFSIGSTFRLKKALQAMGMKNAFHPQLADLSGGDPPNAKNPRFNLSEVHHKAFVQVDERGSEAAAATGIVAGSRGIGPSSSPLRFNRPFLFLIRHAPSDAFLFFGRVYDPRRR